MLERLIALVVLLMLLFGISTYSRGDAFGLPWFTDEPDDVPACEDCAPRRALATFAAEQRHGGEVPDDDDEGDDEDDDEKDDKDGDGRGKREGGRSGKEGRRGRD